MEKEAVGLKECYRAWSACGTLETAANNSIPRELQQQKQNLRYEWRFVKLDCMTFSWLQTNSGKLSGSLDEGTSALPTVYRGCKMLLVSNEE